MSCCVPNLFFLRKAKEAAVCEQQSDATEMIHLPEDYVQGDDDDSGIGSLLVSDSARGLKHELVLALPREKWADAVLQQTPRSACVSLERYTPSPRTISPATSQTTSGEQDNDPAATAQIYWRRVARNMMNFHLGKNLENIDAKVAFECDSDVDEADFVINRQDAFCAYKQVTTDLAAWIEKRTGQSFAWSRLRVDSVEMKTSQRAASKRNTISGQALISPGTPSDRRHSPKMFLDSGEDELRTFVGIAECGVPLLRVNLLHCAESSPLTRGVTVQGLLIVNVTMSEQIKPLAFTYTKWIIEDIVKNFLDRFDFIRISAHMRESNARVVDALLAAGVFLLYKDRVIRFARVSASEVWSKHKNQVPIFDGENGGNSLMRRSSESTVKDSERAVPLPKAASFAATASSLM